MFVVCVEFEIMPRYLNHILLSQCKNAALSRKLQAGFQQFDVSQDQTNNNICFYMKSRIIKPRLKRIKLSCIIMNSTVPLNCMDMRKIVRFL